MPYLRQLNDIRITDTNWAGDKAARLGELLSQGFTVPRGVCVSADAYRDAIAGPMGERIFARLASTEIDDPMDLESAAEEIRGWIETAPLPPGLAEEMPAALAALDAASFAVRASRIREDVPNPSASGAQAHLAVVGADAVLQTIRRCWASPWNSRALYFRHRKKMDQKQVTLAVVIQPMIGADAAGVMFTANPLTGAADEIHVDAAWGLGEAVIAARLKPDHFVVAKNDLALCTRALATKGVMDLAAPSGGVQTVAVPADKQQAACLSDAQVIALAELGRRVEAHFAEVQHIEWCRLGEQIFLLQTRPLRNR